VLLLPKKAAAVLPSPRAVAVLLSPKLAPAELADLVVVRVPLREDRHARGEIPCNGGLAGVGEDGRALGKLVRHRDGDAEEAVGHVGGDVGFQQVPLLAVLQLA
jgi:hypothetical protein